MIERHVRSEFVWSIVVVVGSMLLCGLLLPWAKGANLLSASFDVVEIKGWNISGLTTVAGVGFSACVTAMLLGNQKGRRRKMRGVLMVIVFASCALAGAQIACVVDKIEFAKPGMSKPLFPSGDLLCLSERPLAGFRCMCIGLVGLLLMGVGTGLGLLHVATGSGTAVCRATEDASTTSLPVREQSGIPNMFRDGAHDKS